MFSESMTDFSTYPRNLLASLFWMFAEAPRNPENIWLKGTDSKPLFFSFFFQQAVIYVEGCAQKDRVVFLSLVASFLNLPPLEDGSLVCVYC